MEIIDIIRAGFLIFVIVMIVRAIRASVQRRRQKKVDEIAHNVLADFDFDKEREEIKLIGVRYVSEKYRCPRCNGILVMRKGIYGTFWGCNHYPECGYTGRLGHGLLREKAKRTYRAVRADFERESRF